MPIEFVCPNCQKKLRVKDEMAGKTGKCPCGTQIKIPQPANQPAQVSAAGQMPNQGMPGQAAPNPVVANQGAAASSAFDSAFGGVPTNQPLGGSELGGSEFGGAQPMAGPAAAPTVEPPTAPPPENLQNLNPEFKIQCLQCGQEYPMRPDLYGQTVACKCGAPIRFDDPLGSGGAMIDQDPLGLGAVMDNPGTPVAYMSQSRAGAESKKAARQREEDVLKMYIKDDGTEDGSPAPKNKKRKKSAAPGAEPKGELSAGKIISVIVGVIALFSLGIGMMIEPDMMSDVDWSEAMDGGIKGVAVKLVWSFWTGIVVTALASMMALYIIISPKKAFLDLSEDDDDE